MFSERIGEDNISSCDIFRLITLINKWRCSIYGIQLPGPRGLTPIRSSAPLVGLVPTLLDFLLFYILIIFYLLYFFNTVSIYRFYLPVLRFFR